MKHILTSIKSTGSFLSKNKPLTVAGTGLSAAAVIFCYTTFATKAELSRCEKSNRQLWQELSDLKVEHTRLASTVEAIRQYGIFTRQHQTDKPNIPPKLK